MACRNARTTLLVEREAIDCESTPAAERCADFRASLRTNARFALRAPLDAPWPFGKEIRAQCGGVLGLREVLEGASTGGGDAAPGASDEGGSHRGAALPGAGAPAPDVDLTLARALERYGTLDALPYSKIMRAVVRYEPRPRSRR